MTMMSDKTIVLVFTLVMLALPLRGSATQASQELLDDYKVSGAGPFGSSKGEELWRNTNNGRSCVSCHSQSVKDQGRHERTGKVIEAMAPTVNSKRLQDSKKMKKWFLRNCKWVYGRECTAQEKGDILQWLSEQ